VKGAGSQGDRRGPAAQPAPGPAAAAAARPVPW
jgi:hypothetical protein